MYSWTNVVVFPFLLVLSSWVQSIVSLYIQKLHTNSGKERLQWLQVLLLLVILPHHNVHFCEVTIQTHPNQMSTQLQYKAWKKHQFRDRLWHNYVASFRNVHCYLSNYLPSFPYFALIPPQIRTQNTFPHTTHWKNLQCEHIKPEKFGLTTLAVTINHA